MPWRPLPSVAFAIATAPFTATEQFDLPLQIGDHIYIIEQGGARHEWYRGYLVAPPSLLAGLTSDRGQQLEHRVFSGIFPANCVDVREYLGEGKLHGQEREEDGALDESNADIRQQRRSEALAARRKSKRLSRKQSTRSLKKDRKSIFLPEEPMPMPRDPKAPKPLAPVPLLRVGDESGISASEPLVDEIASCMREWHDARLHELLLARGYSQLAKVEELVKRVDVARSQLMHDVLTQKELVVLREDTVWDLVAGNKMLSDEVIVRSPTEKGRILTADDSVIEMTKLQANMSILDRPPKPVSDKHMLHHLLVDARSLVMDGIQPGTLHVTLFSKEHGEKPQPISEGYAISVPLPETPSTVSEDQPQTLFVNLSNTDVGVGAERRSLYVVFKLLRDEPVRQAVYGQGINHTQKPSLLNSSHGGSQNSTKGRLSVFGSQRKKSDHGRTISSATSRPGTSQSQRSDRTGTSSKAASDNPVSGEVKLVRRCVGVGAVEVTKLAQSKTGAETTVTLWTPTTSSTDDKSDGSDDWMDIIRELSRGASGGYARVSSLKRLDVFVKAFAAADLAGLIRNTPTQLHNILWTPKLGFSGVPTEERSDIYLTLTEPRMPRGATLAHSKFGAVPLNQKCQTSLSNLQLTLEVRKASGERFEECIFTSSNHQGHTAWRTTGVERGEGWNQTIRLAIPAEEVPGSHVVMSIADSPNFPFALAWVPLWEFDAFVRDGDHQVSLYVYDEYSSSIIGGKGAYLALPPWHDKNDSLQASAATISLRTFLSSTEYSQDRTLLGVLHWRNYHGDGLQELLERFPFVPEIEVVKLLGNVFEVMFEILHEYEDIEAYEDLIFYNLVVILGIGRDKRFELGNIIEDYATSRHDWPRASKSLARAFHRLVSRNMDPDASRKLRATLKVGDQMLKLIVDSMKSMPGPAHEDDFHGTLPVDRQEELKEELQRLFVAVMSLLRSSLPVLLGTQTLLIQRFHTWLPELTPLMTPNEILEVATDLLDSCSHARGKMTLYRLILIVNYSHLDVFKAPATRASLMASTFTWLEPYWGWVPEPDQQWRDSVRLCCSVVAAQMEHLGEDSCQYVPKLAESFGVLKEQPRHSKRVFSMLFPTSYPFPTRPTTEDIDVDEAMLEIAALLAAALTSERKLYFDTTMVDVPSVLTQALDVSQTVLSCQAFPRSWLSLLISHHRYSITALERIEEVLIESLPDVYAPDASEAFEFDTAIWRAYFNTLFAALGSPILAMETFPEQKRRAVWKIAGDVRELGANLLKRSWEAIGWETDDQEKQLYGFERMGGYQVQFVPELVAPIVELCLSVHGSLRAVAIEVLRSMIISAWQIDQDLSLIQTAMIDCLDKLCRDKDVTEAMLQKTFVPEMLEQFKPLQRTIEDSLYSAVVEMFTRIQELLEMLASVHSGNTAVNDASRLVDTLHLMEFLRDVQSEDAYIRYVHQLTAMQIAAGNITEAGLALQMHADRHEWDPNTQLVALEDPEMPAQSAFERKETLYFQMCQHYEKGQSWKRALAAYRELAVQYELNIFDYAKLARTQRAIAGVQERISRGDRPSPRYFRVVYRGLGFPATLRDKQFIFEGYPNDRLALFEDRMQQLHPSAQLLRGGAEPAVEGQFLQIYAVSPNKDIEHMVYQRTKVSQAVREYNLIANPRKFAMTSRHPARDIPITEQVVEKIIYTAAEEFPTILRRSEIVNIEIITLLPIEAAIERTTRKTQELLAMEKRIASGADEGAMSRLTDDLLSSVDPDSDTSVARYRGLLPASESADSQSIDPSLYGRSVDLPLEPMQSALKVALLDHALAIRRCLALYKREQYLPARAELLPRFEANFQHELNILFPQRDRTSEDEVSPRQSIDDAHAALTAAALEQQQQQQQSEAGAQHQDGEEGQDTERRHGRRRSMSFLKRGSSRQGREPETNGDGDGRQSRGGSRQARERSSSRLSFLRGGNEQQQQQQQEYIGRRGSEVGVGEKRRGSLKKRLSFFDVSNGKSGG
ncbi:putative SH3 domain, dedicator of cytokinesis, C2 DOCK-type domain, DOCKER domain-containing protein [Septoria linicola]|nr:putative SH3 domain, dedicator of cytokinesis, C2 DOCK-type domain, DOCKER domain-containing protein [Septoria linicola]